ncbi:MAG TPA: glycosyl hydrolase 53 family protein, partial [Panacibacter sp.]|nr:glycosyl hydrolase 53 family protein [Panacibacter sp.]
IAGSTDQTINAYPATKDGQAQFITVLVSSVRLAINNDYFGVCYWAPDWVAFKGSTATNGSPWENLTLFDFQNNALPALDSLGKTK